MNFKEVCTKLLRAETEAEVSKIIAGHPEFANPDNWKPLDGRETNFNVTSNQASDGGKALTELMTNMVDAILLKRAHEEGIDPKGKNAPQTMYEAVDKLIKNLYGGRLANLDPNDKWLKGFSEENLVIGITGAKRREGLPSYTFVDRGEGQNPGSFENTFLSLSAGTKKSIPFVQGKFNMGSSGVLRYCGTQWYKLIVSRRHDARGSWGWTIIRRRPGDAETLPIAEYFILNGSNIPSFDEECIYPFNTANGERYDAVSLKTGTIVKLYDYNVGSTHQGFSGAREAMIENLVETILPFRLLDFRHTGDTRTAERERGIDPRGFYGMEYLLLRSHQEDAAGSGKIHVGGLEDKDLGIITVDAIPLKEPPRFLKKTRNRVFHTVNGQVQFKQQRGYFSRCGFPALKDRAVLIINASGLTFKAHNDVWKGDREHISQTIQGEQYQKAVTKIIKESEALKDLHQKIAQQELERSTESESDELFQKLVDSDSNFAGLLSRRNPRIKLPSSGGEQGNESGSGEFTGKFSPTFLRLEERSKIIEMPVNGERPVVARTDVENGYFNRPDNRGRLLIDDEIRDVFTIREHLHNGRLVLFVVSKQDSLKVGDSLTFKIALHDDALPAPVESEEITVSVVDKETKRSKRRQNKEREAKSGEGGNSNEGKGEDAPVLGLPAHSLLTYNGREIDGEKTKKWPEGFDETDGGYAEDLGEEGIMYFINYDNSYHLKYRAQGRSDIAKDAVTKKYILGMRILMLGFEQAWQSLQNTPDDTQGSSDDDIVEYVDQFRRVAAKGASTTVMALAENLPKIMDASAVQNEDE